MLVADWLALLRADPRLPAEFMDAEWPATRSVQTYRRIREKLARASLRNSPNSSRPGPRLGAESGPQIRLPTFPDAVPATRPR